MRRTRDDVELHFIAPRLLAKKFKEALARSEFLTQSSYFRSCMRDLIRRVEANGAIKG
jgi:hypothetical protein